MNNIIIDYNGTKLSIAQHKNDNKTAIQEVALIDEVDEKIGMPIYRYGSNLDSLISTLTKIKKDLDEGKYN